MKRVTQVVAGLTLMAAVAAAPAALGNHGDIHARCDGDRPVITQRPPGTEHITVVCLDGIPDYRVMPEAVPVYDPVTQEMPRALPPDFGGWVMVWLNGRPLKTPYDPIRNVQEPGAYLAASTGRVMMPIRFFTEAFGGEVQWVHSEARARLIMRDREQMLTVIMNSRVAAHGFVVLELDQEPVLFQDRLFVPVRFLAEGFGAKVDWDHFSKSARVTMPGAACVSPVYCGEVR